MDVNNTPAIAITNPITLTIFNFSFSKMDAKKATSTGTANVMIPAFDASVNVDPSVYSHCIKKTPINPGTIKFSDLPDFVAERLDPNVHHKVAMFCTGGIRCEKFAPYMKELGFDEVYQLEGGILRYLEQVAPEESLWEGECFVFDDRRTVDENLQKGIGPDYSQSPKADNPE